MLRDMKSQPTGLRAAAVGAAFGIALASGGAWAQLDQLSIMAPASPGGGWDQTARAMQKALQDSGTVRHVEVTNVTGAGGTIGLAQFVSRSAGQADQLMITGLVMVGAILTNQSPVTLEQTTPIARLTGEYEVIVVPAASEITSLDQLLDQLKADPASVSWAGGSAGGTDHILAGLIAKAVGADPALVNYVPFSGGGEALASLLANDVTAGVSGLGEFEAQIAAGELRALAISSPERLEGYDIPTLMEQGVPVELSNWRGVVAPPGIDDAERDALVAAVEAMVNSESWQTTLTQRNWMSLYLAGDEFAEFLKNDQARATEILKDIGLVQ